MMLQLLFQIETWCFVGLSYGILYSDILCFIQNRALPNNSTNGGQEMSRTCFRQTQIIYLQQVICNSTRNVVAIDGLIFITREKQMVIVVSREFLYNG